MIGGTGHDTYYVDNAGDVVVEYANEGTDWVATTISYTLGHNLENLSLLGTGAMDLTGNELDNALHGNGYTNVLSGGLGNDRLYAGNGDDQLWGGDGNDFLDGDFGVDAMSGGAGNDTYHVDNSADVVTEAVGQGTDRVQTSATYSLATGSEVEILETTDATAMTALDLVGNAFDQTITGNNGTNTIVGGLGLDVMTGGASGDVFVWTSTAESGVAGAEADVVTDFNGPLGDLLAVNLIDADVTVGGNQAFSFIGTAPITGAGQINYFTTATDTYILLSTDADVFQEMTIHLAGVHAVQASWFVL